MPSLSTLLCASLVVRVFSSPYVPSIIYRDAASTNSTPAINATILDNGGQDITSSFQIMLYHPQVTPITNNSLSNRQATLSRPINVCSAGAFYESFCTPEHNKAGSLQSYIIICNVVVPVFDTAEDGEIAVHIGFIPNQAIESRLRNGHCAKNEICVPGLGAGISRSGRRMASCVSTQFFVKYINSGNNGQQGFDLGGMSASMVVGQLDGTTPMEVDTFEIDAETNTGRTMQKKTCRDCMELKSGQFGSETEALKVETTLLTTGAMAGVLWLAILSG